LKSKTQKYVVLFAYIFNKEEKIFYPQFLYWSHSRAIWRVAPSIESKKDSIRIDKGYEGFSCDLDPALNFSLVSFFEKKISTSDNSLKEIKREFVLRYALSGWPAVCNEKYKEEVQVEKKAYLNMPPHIHEDEIPPFHELSKLDLKIIL